MTAPELLAELDRRGIAVRVVGGNLRLRPATALDDALVAELRERKPEVIVLCIRDAELQATRDLAAALSAWRRHVDGCVACDLADRRRCEEATGLAEAYHRAWREVFVVEVLR